VYKGSKKLGTRQVFLRSYDSRKEPAIEPNATIWQAGRATSATALAFKPIQIGQSVFLDEGAGKYNPAPMVLDEAVCNEWPGREVGVFISIGTGKRPDGTNQQQHLWWEGFVSSGIGDFAEARRRLINKIEDCEKIHQGMKDHLARRQVNPENYYRLNVNVGVGEFGMNEWSSLSDISTNTRMYLSEHDVQSKTFDAAAKLARIYRAKIRWERAEKGEGRAPRPLSWEHAVSDVPDVAPNVVELPAEEVNPNLVAHYQNHPAMLSPYQARRPQENDKFVVVSSDEYPQPVSSDNPPRQSNELVSPVRWSGEHSAHDTPKVSFEEPPHQNPPPRPPKTPMQGTDNMYPRPLSVHGHSPSSTLPRPPHGMPLPYPDEDGPPPIVNKATKPDFSR
jgi:hypothetical protein